jgi:hypothetical protein
VPAKPFRERGQLFSDHFRPARKKIINKIHLQFLLRHTSFNLYSLRSTEMDRIGSAHSIDMLLGELDDDECATSALSVFLNIYYFFIFIIYFILFNYILTCGITQRARGARAGAGLERRRGRVR